MRSSVPRRYTPRSRRRRGERRRGSDHKQRTALRDARSARFICSQSRCTVETMGQAWHPGWAISPRPGRPRDMSYPASPSLLFAITTAANQRQPHRRRRWSLNTAPAQREAAPTAKSQLPPTVLSPQHHQLWRRSPSRPSPQVRRAAPVRASSSPRPWWRGRSAAGSGTLVPSVGGGSSQHSTTSAQLANARLLASRSLKLKCSKVWPCTMCERRGCASICPEGVLERERPRQKQQQQEDLSKEQMAHRIAVLEAALSSTTSHPHAAPIRPPASPRVSPTMRRISPLPKAEIIAPPGTLSGAGGETRYVGSLAGSAYLRERERDALPLPTLATSFDGRQFAAPRRPSPESTTMIRSESGTRGAKAFLPSWEEAGHMLQSYWDHVNWMCVVSL